MANNLGMGDYTGIGGTPIGYTQVSQQGNGLQDVLSNMSDIQKINGQFAVNKAIARAGYKKDANGNLIKYSVDANGNPVIDPNGQPIIDYGAIADSLNKQGFGNLIDPTLQTLSNNRITNSTNQAALNQVLAGQKAAGIAVGQGTAFKPTIATPSTPAGTPSYTPPASSDGSTPASSNAPTNAPTPSGIDLSKYSDGDLMILSGKDPATFKAIQAQIGTTVDGKFGNNTLKSFRQAKAQTMTPTPANIAAAYGSNSGDNANGQVQPENTVQVTPEASTSDNSGTFSLPDISTSAPSNTPSPLAIGSQVGAGGVAPGTFQGSYPTPSQNIPESPINFDAGAFSPSDLKSVALFLSQKDQKNDGTVAGVNAAFQRYLQAKIAATPQIPTLYAGAKDDPVDIKNQNAKNDAINKAAIAKTYSDALDAISTATPNAQSQKSASLANRSAQDTRDLVDNAHADGYKAVTPANIDTHQKALTQYTKLENAESAIKKLQNDSNLETMSDDDFNNKLTALSTPLAAADDAMGVGAASEFNNTLRKDASIGQTIKTSKSLMDVPGELLRNGWASQNRQKSLNVLLGTVSTMKESGSAISQLQVDRGTKRTAADDLTDKLLGGKNNPIPYSRGMKTIPGKYYNVNGSTIQSKGQ